MNYVLIFSSDGKTVYVTEKQKVGSTVQAIYNSKKSAGSMREAFQHEKILLEKEEDCYANMINNGDYKKYIMIMESITDVLKKQLKVDDIKICLRG